MLNALVSPTKSFSNSLIKKNKDSETKIETGKKLENRLRASEEDLKEKKFLLHPHPFITEEDYIKNFSIGDIPCKYWNKISKGATDLKGTWKVIVNKSDDINNIMKALGYSVFKRQIMSAYKTVVDIDVRLNNSLDEDEDKNTNNQTHSNNEYYVISITSHLPMSLVKKGTVAYNCKYNTFHDNELGNWKTAGCFIDGRAIQRREGEKGIMFDTRVVFLSSLEEIEREENINTVDGPQEITNDVNLKSNILTEEKKEVFQLFRWTYIPYETQIPIVSNRWFKKIN